MERREDMLGIAEKLPKSADKLPKALEKALESKALASKAVSDTMLPKAAASPAVRRRIVALESRSLRKRH
jgi:phosphoribosyl-ATP pyrophosphohydrolase